VHQHVERTRLGYETRALEREIQHLDEAKKAAKLELDRAGASEHLLVKARAFNVATEGELQALVSPTAPAAPSKGRP